MKNFIKFNTVIRLKKSILGKFILRYPHKDSLVNNSLNKNFVKVVKNLKGECSL